MGDRCPIDHGSSAIEERVPAAGGPATGRLRTGMFRNKDQRKSDQPESEPTHGVADAVPGDISEVRSVGYLSELGH